MSYNVMTNDLYTVVG